jgi:hypothetical protein
MKYFFKSLLLAAGFLIFSQDLPAQHFISVAPLAATPLIDPGAYGNPGGYVGGDFYAPENNFYDGPDSSASLSLTPIGSSDSSDYESSSGDSGPAVTYAQGDADFVPSKYMKYKKAVNLGNKILQEENDPSPHPPLGDVARAARAKLQSTAPAPKHITVTQDNQGKMIVCKGDSKACP